jgi:hypothetical protein
MASTVAEVMVATLKASGVHRVYGIPGDSLNGFTDALRRDGGITWEHVRHEEAAAFAAVGEAALTGELAVCAASCGPGNLHLINGLFDANRSRVPVLAIGLPGHGALRRAGHALHRLSLPAVLPGGRPGDPGRRARRAHRPAGSGRGSARRHGAGHGRRAAPADHGEDRRGAPEPDDRALPADPREIV